MSDVAIRVWPGPSPAILFVHATGFCKEVWSPLIDELRLLGVTRQAVALDQPGHGDSGGVDEQTDWWDLGRDALDIARGLGSGTAGVGHSSGGAALLMAELLDPGRFDTLILIEPVVFPPPHRRQEDSALVEAALRRKAAFGSREEALQNFRGRGPFARWDDRVLEAYVDGCLERFDGGVRLKCRPEVEADFYRSGTAHGVWDRMGEVETRSIVVAGEDSSTHPADFGATQAARLPRGQFIAVHGGTHFVPMEQPGVIASIIAEGLDPGPR